MQDPKQAKSLPSELAQKQIDELYQKEVIYIGQLYALKMLLEERKDQQELIRAINQYINLVMPRLRTILGDDTQVSKPKKMSIYKSILARITPKDKKNLTSNKDNKNSLDVLILLYAAQIHEKDKLTEKSLMSSRRGSSKPKEDAMLREYSIKQNDVKNAENTLVDRVAAHIKKLPREKMLKDTVTFLGNDSFHKATINLIRARDESIASLENDKIIQPHLILPVQRVPRYMLAGKAIHDGARDVITHERTSASWMLTADYGKQLSNIGDRLSLDAEIVLDYNLIKKTEIVSKRLARSSNEDQTYFDKIFEEARQVMKTHLDAGPHGTLDQATIIKVMRISNIYQSFKREPMFDSEASPRSDTVSDRSSQTSYSTMSDKGSSRSLGSSETGSRVSITRSLLNSFYTPIASRLYPKATSKEIETFERVLQTVERIQSMRSECHPEHSTLISHSRSKQPNNLHSSIKYAHGETELEKESRILNLQDFRLQLEKLYSEAEGLIAKINPHNSNSNNLYLRANRLLAEITTEIAAIKDPDSLLDKNFTLLHTKLEQFCSDKKMEITSINTALRLSLNSKHI